MAHHRRRLTSSASSTVTSNSSVASTDSRYIARNDEVKLGRHHDGKRCILTREIDGERGSVEWAHIIPHAHAARGSQLKRLLTLKLCRPDMTITSYENIVPLDKSLHEQFDNRHWTFFPTLDVLHEWIYAEEEWIAYRKCRIASDGLDIGRPNHRVFRAVNPFDVHWSDSAKEYVPRLDNDGVTIISNGAFPVLFLLAGIPNVVYASLSRLTNLYPRTRKTGDAMDLAIYLTDLWQWTPSDADPRRPAIVPLWHFDMSSTTEPTFPPIIPNHSITIDHSSTPSSFSPLNNSSTFSPTPGTGPTLHLQINHLVASSHVGDDTDTSTDTDPGSDSKHSHHLDSLDEGSAVLGDGGLQHSPTMTGSISSWVDTVADAGAATPADEEIDWTADGDELGWTGCRI